MEWRGRAQRLCEPRLQRSWNELRPAPQALPRPQTFGLSSYLEQQILHLLSEKDKQMVCACLNQGFISDKHVRSAKLSPRVENI